MLSDPQNVTLFDLPVISRITPNYVPIDGGSVVTISGTGSDFAKTSKSLVKVRFDKSATQPGTFDEASNTIRVSTPLFQSGGASDVEVALNGEQFSVTGTDTVQLNTFGVKALKPRSIPTLLDDDQRVEITIALSGLGASQTPDSDGWLCHFGAGIPDETATYYDTGKQIKCKSPALTENNTREVSISAKGSAQGSGSGMSLEYYHPFRVLALSRYSGPKSGGVQLVAHTDGLVDTIDGIFCRFDSGPARSGELLDGSDSRCAGGPSGPCALCQVDASTAREQQLSLSLTRTDSLDEVYSYLFFSNTSLPYIAYGLQKVTPSNVPADRDADLTLTIDGYDNCCHLNAKAGCASCTIPDWTRGSECKVIDEGAGLELKLEGTVATVNEKLQMTCPLPFGSCLYTKNSGDNTYSSSDAHGGSCVNPGNVTCVSVTPSDCPSTWPSQVAKATVVVEISLEDNNDFTESAKPLTIYPPITLTASSPNYGPVRGGFTFYANGTNLLDIPTDGVKCRFSRADDESKSPRVQNAQRWGDSGISCVVPELGQAATYNVEVSLNDIHYSNSTTRQQVSLYPLTAVAPQAGPLVGGTLVALTMVDVPDVPHTADEPAFYCRFTCDSDVIDVIANVTMSNTGAPAYSCLSPNVTRACPDGSLAISHSLDGQLFTLPRTFQRYKAPTITSLSPSIGPSSGGFTVRIGGEDLEAQPYGIPYCKFGSGSNPRKRENSSGDQATWIDCRMPQVSPKDHELSISLNSHDADVHVTDFAVTAFTIGSRTPVSVPLNVSRDPYITVNGFGKQEGFNLRDRLTAKTVALVCKWEPVVAAGYDCGTTVQHVIGRVPDDTSTGLEVVQCKAPVLNALGASNTKGACELSIEACIFENATAAAVYAAADPDGDGVVDAELDLTDQLAPYGPSGSNQMHFSASGLRVYYYEPPVLTGVTIATRIFNDTNATADTGDNSAYAYQEGTAIVAGNFPDWPESSYLRPHPVCRFGGDATPLPSDTHSRTEVLCNFAAHKQGDVIVTVSMSGENDVYYGGDGADVLFTYEGCPAGQYAPAYDDECRLCELGKYQRFTGMADCVTASATEYVDVPGAVAPFACPANTNHSTDNTPILGAINTQADEIEDCICKPDFYSSVVDTEAFEGLPGHACLACDVNGKGGNCTGGTKLPRALPKFWYDGTHPLGEADSLVDTPLNGTHPLFTFFMCGEPHPHIKCPGGMPNTCGEGYVERTCIACNSSGTGRFEKDGQCIECPETTQGAIFVLIAMCLVFVVVGLCFLIAIKLAKINVKAFASFSIGIRYWQVISTFGTLNLCWPAPVAGGFSFFNYIAFDLDDYVAQAACAVDRVSQMTKTIAYIVAPVIFMGTVFSFFALISIVNRIKDLGRRREPGSAHSSFGQKTIKHLNVCIHAFMYFLNLAYMMLARRVLAIFDCKYYCQLPKYDSDGHVEGCTPGGGYYYLEVDPRMECYVYDLTSEDEHTVSWTQMAMISWLGVAMYLIGIPGLFFYKLFSNRAYTIFTKSLSMLSEQVETGDLRPEKAVQRMLELANSFGHSLDRKKKKLRRAGPRKENDFLKKHTGTLTNLLQQAHKQFLLTNQSENAPKYAAMKRELVEDVNNIVEQLDARVHLRSRYGFLLARWRPTAFYWELVIMMQKLALAILASHLKSHMVISAICAQFVVFVAFALQLHFNPYETSQDNRLDFYVCLSSEIVLFSGVLFQQTAGPDCNAENNQIGPGSVAMREALGWINVAFMIGTTLMILWQLGKNVSFRAKKMALMAAGLGAEAAGQAGGTRMHAGHGSYDRDSSKRNKESHFLLGSRDGSDGAPISDEELASAKAEAAAKNDVWVAAAEADFRFMNLWMEASLPLDPLDERQQTPLMVASHAGATYMCALLIAKGADVRLQDRDGWTCLHHAVDAGHEKTVEYLCSRAVPLDAQASTNGFTALHITAFHDMRKLASALLDAGARIDLKSTDGKTPLMLANERGSNRFLAAVSDKGKYEKRATAATAAPAKSRFHVRV